MRRRKLFRGGIVNNLNSILLEGNLVLDPIFLTTTNGMPLCTFSIASNRFYRQESGLEKEVSFFDVETWARLADMCREQGHKGRSVRIVGRLKQSRWNGDDGKLCSRVSIVAEHIEFRGGTAQKSVGAADGTAGKSVPVENEIAF
jgi:single-strand DNA-binding protein